MERYTFNCHLNVFSDGLMSRGADRRVPCGDTVKAGLQDCFFICVCLLSELIKVDISDRVFDHLFNFSWF